jgi:hypothetical protein
MRVWERTFLGATLLIVCAATSAEAVVSTEIVQQVDAVLADRTPIVYVAIPGDVARAGLSLVRVVVTNVQNPAAAPVDVMVSLCSMHRNNRVCKGPSGSFSLFPVNQPGTFVLRIPRDAMWDTMGGQNEEMRELALEFKLDSPKHDRISGPVAITIGRLLWAQ